MYCSAAGDVEPRVVFEDRSKEAAHCSFTA